MADEHKKCTKCKRYRKLSYFGVNPEAQDGRDIWCNDCRKELVHDLTALEEYWSINGRTFKPELWNNSMELITKKYKKADLLNGKSAKEVDSFIAKKSVGLYFQKMNLKHSFEGDVYTKRHTDFTVDDELKEKWGAGYSPEEYQLFEKKYERLARSYSEKTEMHREALITYIRYRVKEEMASASGSVREAKEWGQLASKQAQDAKINVSQLSKSDISGGIDVISQLFEAVEGEVGIIPLLPKLREQPYDDADMIIWCIVNYIRRLEEKPTVKYSEIYAFYDDMLREHYKQNGWNQEQIEIFLKKRNNVFRDMEQVYFEPLYSQSADFSGGDED